VTSNRVMGYSEVTRFFAAALVLSAAALPSAFASPPRGCIAPQHVAEIIAIFRDHGWSTITPSYLENEHWPVRTWSWPPAPDTCDLEKCEGWAYYYSPQAIVDAQSLCGSTISFQLQKEPTGCRQVFHSFSWVYTASTRREALRFVSQIIKALRPPTDSERGAPAPGRPRDQWAFLWPEGPLTVSVEINLIDVSREWRCTFGLGLYSLPSGPAREEPRRK
jgi:hypothetical protein